MKNRILIVTAFPEGTGSWIVVEKEAQMLKELGYRVHILYCDTYSKLESYKQHTRIILDPLPGLIKSPKADGFTFNMMTSNEINVMQSQIRETIKNVYHIFEPDLIISHHLWNISYLVSQMETPYVVWSHGPDITRYYDWKRFSYWTLIAAKRAHQILVPSYDMKHRVHASLKLDAHIIHLGFDNLQFFYTPKVPKDYTQIVTVGAVHESKGLSLIETTMWKCPELTLIWIGEGSATNTSPPNIKYIGKKSHREIAPILRKSGYFLSASNSESFGLALLEAIACGCIPIVKPLPSFKEICNQIWNDCVLTYQTESELYQILQSLSDKDPNTLLKKGVKVSEHANTFTWQAHKKNLNKTVIRPFFQ